MDDTLVDWFELIVEEHKREPFYLIHGYFLPMAGFVGTYAGKYLGIPSVVSIRGNDIERAAFDPSKLSHVMYALQNASPVTTNGSELAKKAKAFVDREIFVIPNGIDTERFKPVEKNLALAEAIGLQKHIILPVFYDPKTSMFFGDAKKALTELVAELKTMQCFDFPARSFKFY